MQTFFNAGDIITRLKKLFNCSTNEQLAEFLGVSKSTVGSWKNRNTIDLKLIVAKCNNANYNWIINGEGEMLKDTSIQKKTQIPVNSGVSINKETTEGELIVQLLKQENELLKDKINDLNSIIDNKDYIIQLKNEKINILQAIIDSSDAVPKNIKNVG